MHASIVIPLLRQKPGWLEQSVGSALAQSAPCEVIVVTDRLTPRDNLAVLHALDDPGGHLAVLTAPRGCGYACAINLGIGHATTDRVGFLLADDWLEADAVERCLAHGEDIVSTQMTIYEESGETPLERSTESNARLAERTQLYQRAEYLGHFLLLDRQKLLAVGGVDPGIGCTGPDDFDLLWTLLEHGASARIVEAPLYNYRDHGESWRLTLQDAETQLANLERILDKHGVSGDMRDEISNRHARWYGKTIGEVRRYETGES